MIKDRGGYAWAFQELFRRGCAALWPDEDLATLFQFPEYDVTDEKVKYPTCSDVDGVLLTGSKASASEDAPWINKLVDFVVKCVDNAPSTNYVSAIGVCFGHQVIGRALGLGVEVSATKIDLSEDGKKVFFGLDNMVRVSPPPPLILFSPMTPTLPFPCIVPMRTPYAQSTPLCNPDPTMFQFPHRRPPISTPGWSQLTGSSDKNAQHLHQMHQDIVTDSPSLPVKSLGSTAICTNQIFSRSNRLLSVQGHPEFTNAMVAAILKMRYSRGVLSMDAFQEAMQRANGRHDGDAVGVAFILFLYLPWLKKVMPAGWLMPQPWCDFHAFDELS